MHKSVLALGLLFAVAVNAAAQAPTAPDPARTKAAEELLLAMKMEETFQQGIDTMIKTQLDSEPILVQFEDLLREFARKYLSWSAVKEDYVMLYADVFTESELHELAAFHQTPLGRKLLVALPDLMVREQRITQRIVEAHSKELQEKIKARMTEQQQRGQEAPKQAPDQPSPTPAPTPAPPPEQPKP